ncbi:MAG: TPM domain-containing protein [Clostridia bacterium]|nr:TPM domain-containing protein [Clostridia bacterium]
MKKILIPLLLSIFLILSCVLAVSAYSGPELLIDEAGLLNETDFSYIHDYLEEITDRYGMTVSIVIKNGIGGKEMLEAAEDFYRGAGYGTDGIMLFLDMEQMYYCSFTSGSFDSCLDEERMGQLDDAIVSNFGNSDPYGAFRDYSKLVDKFLGSDPKSDTSQVITIGSSDSTVTTGAGTLLVDDARLLTEEQASYLNYLLEDVTKKHNATVSIVTKNGISGDIEAYTDDYYDYNGYGVGPNHDGCMFLIDMETRRFHITTTGNGIQALTDYGMQEIDDDMVPYLRNGQYYEAFRIFVSKVDDFYTQSENGKPYDNPYYSPDSEIPPSLDRNGPPGVGAGVISGAIGLIASLISVGSMKSKLKSVRYQPAANSYVRNDSMNMTVSEDNFLYSNVTQTRRETESRGSGGGSSVHVGSSGTSHGGHSGSF